MMISTLGWPFQMNNAMSLAGRSVFSAVSYRIALWHASAVPLHEQFPCRLSGDRHTWKLDSPRRALISCCQAYKLIAI
jgi:hypothetical protein